MEFKNFPYDFSKTNNFWIDLFSSKKFEMFDDSKITVYGCYPKISITRKILLFIHSRFSNDGMSKWLFHQQGLPDDIYPDKFNIWCTYENRRPPAENFDLTFSFDTDSFNGTNYYLPLIYLYLDLTQKNSSYVRHKISPSELLKRRNLNTYENKQKFAVSFINNPDQTRLRAIKELGKISKVDLFGRFSNNYAKDKLSISSDYWFTVCFENDIYPGYITEKVLEAWLANTIPLYWGDDKAKILNERAIINLKDFGSLEEFVSFVQDLSKDKQRMIDIISQPLLKRDFSMQELEDFILSGLQKRFS